MKVIAVELQLRHGQWATFFLSSGFVVHERTMEGKTICILNEGNHNNGGWELADSYDEIKYRLLRLFEQEV
jgi:hypothetical protein